MECGSGAIVRSSTGTGSGLAPAGALRSARPRTLSPARWRPAGCGRRARVNGRSGSAVHSPRCRCCSPGRESRSPGPGETPPHDEPKRRCRFQDRTGGPTRGAGPGWRSPRLACVGCPRALRSTRSGRPWRDAGCAGPHPPKARNAARRTRMVPMTSIAMPAGDPVLRTGGIGCGAATCSSGGVLVICSSVSMTL